MGFGRKGRNPTGNELPVVSEGTRLRPSHINQIVAAVDRSTLKGGKGYKFVQTSGGTSLKIDSRGDAVPWSVFTFGDRLCINRGNVWGKGVSQMPLHTTTEWGALPPDFTKKFWSARPVMVGINGANIVATDEINAARSDVATNIIQVPLLTGYYYIEYADWDGREDISALGVGTDLVGSKQFILKHATSLTTSDEVVVVCYIDPEKNPYQGVKGDIWWGLVGNDGNPFKISVHKVDGDYRAFLAYGTVNNTVPIYETGEEVGSSDAVGIAIGGDPAELQIVLQLDYVEGEAFPAPTPSVKSLPISEDITNTDDTAYVVIGTISITTEGSGETARSVFDTQQAVTGSLWVERFKCADNDAVYWVTKI